MNPATWPHLHRPASAAGRPALLLLHGTGGNEHDLVGLADRLAPGAALLAPRGRVSENGANRFFARLAEGVFDPAEVVARTAELADFVVAASARHGLPRLTALGFSNGANVAATLLQIRPDLPVAGAVLLRPMVVLDREAAHGSLTGRRVLLLNGARDPIVPPDHPARLAAHLRAGGASVESHLHPHAAHGLAPDDFGFITAFLAATAD